MKNLLAGILLAMALGGGAHAAAVFIPIVIPIPVQVPAPEKGGYSKIHTVAVLSAAGVNFTLQNNHFMGPKTGHLDIADWKIDDSVAAAIHQYLGNHWAIKDIAYDREQLGAIPNGPLDYSAPKLRHYLGSVPSDGIDAFIVVRPDLEYQAPGLTGLGLENGNGIGDPAPVVWANYEIDIVDAHSLETVAKAYSRVKLREGAKDSFAGLIADNTLKIGDDFALNDGQRAMLRAYVAHLMTASLIETLRSLELGIALPEPGARTLVPIPQDKLPYKNLTTVAVISGIGDELNLERLDTVFSHTSDFAPVPDWQIDDAVVQRAGTILAKRFSVKAAAVDRKAFDRAALLDENYKLDPKFPGLNPDNAIDAYIAFIKLVEPAGTLTPAKKKGLGMWVNGPAETYVLFANYAVAVIDAHTMKIITARAATTSPAQPLRGELAVDLSLWPGHPPQFTPERIAAFKSALTTLLDDSLDETFLALGLTGMMPAETPPPAMASNGLSDLPSPATSK